MWKRLLELDVNAWIERVPTDDNIADDPSRLVLSILKCQHVLPSHLSREEYSLLHRMNAKQVEATLDEVFVDPRAWESVSIAPKSV